MSEPITRDNSFTVRLSADERTTLDALAAQWGLDKSATVRRALQLAAQTTQVARPPLPERGHFITLHPDQVSFPVRLNRKDAHE